MHVDFVYLAHGAAFNIGGDEVIYVGPPVVLLDQVKGFGDSRVASS